MNRPRLALLISSAVILPVSLVIGAASTVAAVPPDTTFGSHVSHCAQMSTGFSGQHNPSHHRGPMAYAMHTSHC